MYLDLVDEKSIKVVFYLPHIWQWNWKTIWYIHV